MKLELLECHKSFKLWCMEVSAVQTIIDNRQRLNLALKKPKQAKDAKY